MKKVLSLFLIIAVLATMVIIPVSAKEFNDIQYSKNEEAIEELCNLGVIEGYGSDRFRPYKTLTRAEACTMVVRAMVEDDLIYSSNSNYFNDVSRDSWYRVYVDTAYRNDLMHGHGHNRFDPNSEVTYIQFATIVLNMLGYNCPELPGEWPGNVEKLINHLGLDYNVSYYDNNDVTQYNLRPYINNEYHNYYDFVYQVKKDAYKKYVEECWGSWVEENQQEYFKKFINQVKDDAYIIQLNGKDIGFYNGETLEDGSYEIGNICIIPEYQGMGIGTRILKDIMELHKEQDLHIQYFKQNPVGNLYEKLGFIPNGETEFHYQMIKPVVKHIKK